MPRYTVKDPISGKTVVLTGDSPPTEAELNQIFAELARPSKPASTEDFTDPTAPAGGAVSRAVAGVKRQLLPTDRLSDVIDGPMYAAQHPIDALSLLLGALKDSHVDQAHKTADSARRVISEPTLGGKLGAVSETLGHGAATLLPVVGPAAARAGETGASGDVAGMLGELTGLLAPAAIKPAMRATAPLRTAAAERLSTSAVGQMEKALNPTRIDTKVMAARVAPEMLNRRVKAGSLAALEERAAKESTIAGQAVDRELSLSSNKTAPVQPLVDQLEKAKEPYVGVTSKGDQVINQPERVKAIQQLQDTLMNYGDDISVESMVKLRRGWDEVVNAARGFVQPNLKTNVKAWAAREGRTALRDALSDAVPDINKINAEYAFWQSIEDITHATNQRRVGQARNLTSTIAGAGGAVAAEAVLPGSGVLMGAGKAAFGAKAASGLKKLIESPGYQMWSAVQKQKLADALLSGNASAIELTIGRGLRAVSQRPQPTPVPAGSMAKQLQADEEMVRR